MRKRQNKQILAIESWDGTILEPRAGMKSMLNFVTELHGARYSYNYCYTPTELEYVLRNIPTKNFSLLYLALHGKPEKIQLGMYTEFEIGLNDLAGMMGTRFAGFGIHFASCAVLWSWRETLQSFMDKTGVLFISGFTKWVDFGESSLVDLALINRWMYARNYRLMFEKMKRDYKSILVENGFEYFI